MRSVAHSPWGFRALLLAVNLAGIWWVHHDLVGAALPGLRILAALPSRDVDKADRLTLVFDRPLSLPGAPGEARLTANPFLISPQVPGTWHWAAPEKLEYRLDRPLPPGRRFTLEASPGLEQMLGRKLLGSKQFRLETRPLELISCAMTSADSENANLELKFNQPVDPADLLRHLKLSGQGSSGRLRFEVLNKAPDATLSVRAGRPQSDQLAVQIDSALAGAGAELPLDKAVQLQLKVVAAFCVVNVDVDTHSLDAESCISIRFSKQLDAAWISDNPSCIKITPPVTGMHNRIDNESLVLLGTFQCGQRYTAELSAAVRCSSGEKLGRDQTVSFDVPDREPGIRFETRGGILSSRGNLLLDLKHVNVPVVHLQAGRVHANNLASHLHHESQACTSREFPERTIPLGAPENEPRSALVDLRKLLGDPLGIYWIRARGPDGTWTSDSTVVAITDLAMTTKQERGGCYVWVTSLCTGRPVNGAEVSAITYNNQVLARAETDISGVARLTMPAGHPDGAAWVITARLGEDMSYIEPQRRPWVLDEVDQSGRESPLAYEVMLYTERGVYRPGETIHLTGIVRDSAGDTPPAFPLSATIYRPDGKDIAQLPISLGDNDQGVFHIEYTAPDIGQTGPYRFRVGLPGSKDSLGGVEALVEEYAPQRLELRTDCPKLFSPDRPVQIEVAARYLFDQPASGLPVRVHGTYKREAFTSRRFADFDFTPPDLAAEQPLPESEQKLDPAGHLLLSVPSPSLSSPGMWRADLGITVSEQGGRSVSRGVDPRVDTAGRYVGLRLPGGRLVPSGVPTAVEWVQVTGSDTDADPGAATYTLIKVQQDTTLQQVDGRYVWKTVERLTEIAHADLPASSGEVGRFDLVCPDPALYRLFATDCLSGSTTRIEFWATMDTNALLSSSTIKPDRVGLMLDRDSYSPGSTARLAIQAPFAGTMLLTIETDRVIDSRLVELAGPTGELELPVHSALRGGAFITATLVRPIDPQEKKWLAHRAIGMTRLRTTHGSHKLELKIEAPGESRPGETIPIRVCTGTPADPRKPAMVHLWAVDEGILLATEFATPDPVGYFFAPRQAEIISADIFGDLVPDYQRPTSMSRIGGDGDAGEDYRKRLKPVAMPRQAPAVIWRKAVPAGPDGSITTELLMPELTGRLRIMAVAVDHDRYGSAAAAVVLSTPLLVEMSCPRFAAPDDVIDLPVKVFNCTETELAVKVTLSSSGPLRLDALPQEPIRILPTQPVVIWVKAVSTGLGNASITVQAEAKSGTGRVFGGKQSTTFGVRPAGPLHSDLRVVSIKAGESYRVAPEEKWLAGSARTTLCLGPRPTVQLQPALEALIEYPYGCVEQTTSRLYALLYAPDLLRIERAGTSRADAVRGMIEAGLSRLWSMQTRSGGLSYWPGDSTPCIWGSTYAAEFIAMAERHGYAASPAFTSELVRYLEISLESDGQDEEVDADLKAQLCYVLARMKHPQPGWTTRLTEAGDELDLAGCAYLAGAWMEMGRKDRALKLLRDERLAENGPLSSATRPASQVHQDSILLHVLLDLDRQHPRIPELVQRLEKARSNGRWGSTLENAAALAALARYQLAGSEPSSFTGMVSQGDVARPFAHTALQVFTLPADKAIEITSSGEGRIHLSLITEGLLKDNTQPGYDRKLVVSRQWLDRAGKPIDAKHIRVGDLILVETSLAAPSLESDETIDHVAIVDALPAGLEVENPRLAGSEDRPNSEVGAPDHVEFRDDRVVVFASAGREKQVFRYALRAITAGSFVVPPIQASCMYDGAQASLHGGGRVLIAR